MAEVRYSTVSCGLLEIIGVHSTPSDQVYNEMVSYSQRYGAPAFFLFSDNETGLGEETARFLREKGLSIVETPSRINPNSNRKIKAWIVEIDTDMFPGFKYRPTPKQKK